MNRRLIGSLVAVLLTCGSLAAATLTPGYTIGSGLLATEGEVLFVDNAATGGGDARHDNGVTDWSAELSGLWNNGDTVTLTGLAIPIWSDTASTLNTTLSGTFSFNFYDLDAGADLTAFDGIGVETLVGSASASFTRGSIGTYYVRFDTPLTFTARSSGIALHISNTAALRLKVNTAASAPGVVRKSNSDGSAVGGSNPNLRLSLAGRLEPGQVSAHHRLHRERRLPGALCHRRCCRERQQLENR